MTGPGGEIRLLGHHGYLQTDMAALFFRGASQPPSEIQTTLARCYLRRVLISLCVRQGLHAISCPIIGIAS